MKAHGLLLGLFLMALFAGCTDSGDTDGTGPGDPVGSDEMQAALPETITGMEFVGNPDQNATAGIWLDDHKAYLSGGSGLRIFDITDPTDPVLLNSDIPDTTSRDVDIMHHPDGNTYAVLAAGTVKLVNVTDPAQAAVVSQTSLCTHNIAVVPNSTIVYSSWSLCQAGNVDMMANGDVEIIDFADPTHPVSKYFAFPEVAMTIGGVPRPVTATSCHDITFNEERQLAYCAGVTDTLIWDISDPWDPQIIQVIDWPGTNIHHAVWAARGGDLLILGDEFTGVLAPTPMCSDTIPYPTSALWFFDVSDMSMPTPVGYFQVSWDALDASVEALSPIYCSTHFGTLVDDRDMMVLGWYSAGTVLIDFSDPANAKEVALYHPDGDTSCWEARYYNGYVYTGDQVRGMDILRIV